MKHPVLLTLSNGTIPGGIESFNQLLKKVVPSMKILSAENIQPSVSIPFLREPLVGMQLAKFVSLQQNDISMVFANGMHAWALDKNKISVITMMHGTYRGLADHAFQPSSPIYWRMKFLLSWFEARSARNATICISNSLSTQQEVEKFYGVKSTVIELPINTSIFKPGSKKIARKSLKWNPGAFIVLFAGNPTFSKGWDILVGLANAFPHLQFKAVCQPSVPAPAKNIEVFPAVPQEDFVTYLRAADVVVFPSRYEGFGFIPLEALACNTPVIAPKIGILREFGCEGFFPVDSNSIEEFRSMLEKIEKNPRKIHTHALINKRFSFENFRKKIKQELKKIEEIK